MEPSSDTETFRKKWWWNVEVWIYGLISGFLGGGATGVTAAFSASVITPEQYNLKGGLKNFMELFLVTFIVSGILSAMSYLKQSPLPPIPDRPTVSVTNALKILVAGCILSSGLLFVSVGCRTSPDRIVYNTSKATTITVDAAMKTWASYVADERLRLSKVRDSAGWEALTAKETKVRKAYEEYQAIARVIVVSQMNAATAPNPTAAILVASKPVIELISTLMKEGQ